MTAEQFRAVLAARGIVAGASTIRKWLQDGLVPGAICHGGRVWEIPEAVAFFWQRPPRKPTRAPGNSKRTEYRRRKRQQEQE